MNTHTKVSEVVYSEYDCTPGVGEGCTHDECPTERVDICEECSREAWEEHEAGVVTWAECLDNRALDEFDPPTTDRENGSEADAMTADEYAHSQLEPGRDCGNIRCEICGEYSEW